MVKRHIAGRRSAMKCKPNRAAVAALTALFLPALATPLRANASLPATPVVYSSERLTFPESASAPIPKVVLTSTTPPQAAVALPTPQFTGIGAVAVLALLLRCRKSILRLVC
jgi:hypothetical protein